jgi:UDP-N-acetylmuramate dehydrogenase
MSWYKDLRLKIKLNEPMKEHTTFKIGGPAEYFIEPRNPDELKSLLHSAKRHNIPVLVLGSGSNILVKDTRLKAIVLHLDSAFFRRVVFQDNHVYAASGVALSRLISLAQKRGLSGLEFLAGIPGTVGGALAMNAGIPGENIGGLVKDAEVMDYSGNMKVLSKGGIRFGYRNSSLRSYIILGARLKLRKKHKLKIKEEINSRISSRRLTQDYSHPSAGCIFKNPRPKHAARLIDLCGMKGKRLGDAGISRRHANFILNLGRAKAEDVLRLMELARRKVQGRFNVRLEPEIKIWQ